MAEDGGRKGFYYYVTKVSIIPALFMPAVLAALIVVGLMEYEVEDQVAEIWIEDSSDLRRDTDYLDNLKGGGNVSGLFMAAASRDRENLFTQERIAAVLDRMQKVEDPSQTYITHKGVKYVWDDVASLAPKPYVMPNLRISPLDAYKEANYAWTAAGKADYYDVVFETVRDTVNQLAVASQACQATCATAGFNFLAGAKDQLVAISVLKGCDPCKQCIDTVLPVQLAQIEGGLTAEAASSSSGLEVDAEVAKDWLFHATALALMLTPGAGLELSYTVAEIGCRYFTCITTLCSYAAAGIDTYSTNSPLNTTQCGSTDTSSPEYQFKAGTWGLKTATSQASCVAAKSVTPGPCDAGHADYIANFVTATDATCSTADQTNLGTQIPTFNYLEVQKILGKLGTNWTTPDMFGTKIDTAAYLAGTKTFTPPFRPASVELSTYLAGIVDSLVPLCNGYTDPYTTTSGEGTEAAVDGYTLGGERHSYVGASTADNLKYASGAIYWYDEGASLGPLSQDLTMGGTVPAIGTYTATNPLTKVTAVQNVYTMATARGIKERVASDDRPSSLGGPQTITLEDADEILLSMKEKFEDTWTEGWDNSNGGDVQFLAFSDDTGVGGTTARTMKEVVDDSAPLGILSYIIVIVFTAGMLFSWNQAESQVLLGFVGVILAIASFGGALGVTALTGDKINLVHSWTLPFLMVGIGVDDMYIVVNALRTSPGTSLSHFVAAMNSVVVPVTITSLTNLGMFAALLLSDVPAVYLMARTGIYAVALLWLTMLTSFPAYVWWDTKRRNASRGECVCCKVSASSTKDADAKAGLFYSKFYKKAIIQLPFQIFVLLAAAGLIAVAVLGFRDQEIGLDLEDFYPEDTQGYAYSVLRKEYFPSFPAAINWGQLDYKTIAVQLQMMRQIESVVATERISDTKTNLYWIAAFAEWGSKACVEADGVCPTKGLKYAEGSDGDRPKPDNCITKWVVNDRALKLDSDAVPGVCKLGSELIACGYTTADITPSTTAGFNPIQSYCPVMPFDTDEEMATCLQWWSNASSFDSAGPGYLTDPDTQRPRLPILHTSGPGTPSLYSINLYNTDAYVSMIDDSRAVCDADDSMGDDPTQCWMSGIGYNYFEQYVNIETFSREITFTALSGAAGCSFVFFTLDFLFGSGKSSPMHFTTKIFAAWLCTFLIAITCIFSIFVTAGVSAMLDVNLTAFSIVSYVLAVGYSVEYSVHVVHRYFTSPLSLETADERLLATMRFLTLPTLLAFLSSTIGIACMAGTDIKFVLTYFFKPLITAMFVTYFAGVFLLPTLILRFGCGRLIIAPGAGKGYQGAL